MVEEKGYEVYTDELENHRFETYIKRKE